MALDELPCCAGVEEFVACKRAECHAMARVYFVVIVAVAVGSGGLARGGGRGGRGDKIRRGGKVHWFVDHGTSSWFRTMVAVMAIRAVILILDKIGAAIVGRSQNLVLRREARQFMLQSLVIGT